MVGAPGAQIGSYCAVALAISTLKPRSIRRRQSLNPKPNERAGAEGGLAPLGLALVLPPRMCPGPWPCRACSSKPEHKRRALARRSPPSLATQKRPSSRCGPATSVSPLRLLQLFPPPATRRRTQNRRAISAYKRNCAMSVLWGIWIPLGGLGQRP
jgi:hypothetical protein